METSEIELDVQGFIDMLKEAELIGTLKTLTWLSLEVSDKKDVTVSDIDKLLSYAASSINEDLYRLFKRHNGITCSIEDIVKERMQKEQSTESQKEA
jgi:hypothetical protein